MKTKEKIIKKAAKANTEQFPIELPSSLKILITGDTGAGKSTMAKALSEHFGIPVFHTDMFILKDAVTFNPYIEFKTKIIEIAETNVSYIMEGCSFRDDLALFKKISDDADIILNFDSPLQIAINSFFNRAEEIKNNKTTHIGFNMCDEYGSTKQFMFFLKTYADFIEEKEKRKKVLDEISYKLVTIKNFTDADKVLRFFRNGDFKKNKEDVFLLNHILEHV